MLNSTGFEKTKKVIIGIIDIIVLHVSIILSFLIRYSWSLPERNFEAYENAAIFISIAFIFLNILFGIYVFYNKRPFDFLYLTIISQIFLTVMIMAMTFFGRWFAFPRSVIGISFVFSTLLLFTWRFIAFKLYLRIDGSKKVMVVGNKDACKRAIFNFKNANNSRHVITKAVVNNYAENVEKKLDTVDIVYLADDLNELEKDKIFDLTIKNDKKVFVSTTFKNVVLIKPNIMSIDDETLLEISNFEISPENSLIKRMVDIIVSGLLLILTSPIFLITAILIKITSKGPVFYRQTRITYNQREFDVLKFRTMSETAEKDSGPVLATANDTRITSVGKYLRALRIDELPQLINVLKGEMSVVGPRPERPFFVKQFQEENKHYYLRHQVRAGITGYAQVYGKYASDYSSKLKFDLIYIKNYSLILDVQILLQTIKTLFDKVSSQGVDEEQLNKDIIWEDVEVYE